MAEVEHQFVTDALDEIAAQTRMAAVDMDEFSNGEKRPCRLLRSA